MTWPCHLVSVYKSVCVCVSAQHHGNLFGVESTVWADEDVCMGWR